MVQCTGDSARALAAARPDFQVQCLVQGASVVTDARMSPRVSRPDTRFGRSDRELLRWLHSLAKERIAKVLDVSPRQVSLDQSFSQLGIDSLKGVEMIGRLSEDLGLDLSPTLLFEFPTLAKLTEHFVRHHGADLLARRNAGLDSLPAAGVALE